MQLPNVSKLNEAGYEAVSKELAPLVERLEAEIKKAKRIRAVYYVLCAGSILVIVALGVKIFIRNKAKQA